MTDNDKKREEIFNTFEREIRKYKFQIDKVDEEGYIYISKGETNYQIHLENSIRNYIKNGNKETLYSVINLLISKVEEPLEWEVIKKHIYRSLIEPNEDNEEYLSIEFDENLQQIFVYYQENKYIHWIPKYKLEEWNIDIETIIKYSDENIDRRLDDTKITLYDLDNIKVGYFDTEFSLNSELILSKSLKSKVENQIGWPIYCAFPNRNSCYLIPESEIDNFVDLFGEIVIEEFEEEAYPISRGIYKIENSFELIGLLEEK